MSIKIEYKKIDTRKVVELNLKGLYNKKMILKTDTPLLIIDPKYNLFLGFIEIGPGNLNYLRVFIYNSYKTPTHYIELPYPYNTFFSEKREKSGVDTIYFPMGSSLSSLFNIPYVTYNMNMNINNEFKIFLLEEELLWKFINNYPIIKKSFLIPWGNTMLDSYPSCCGKRILNIFMERSIKDINLLKKDFIEELVMFTYSRNLNKYNLILDIKASSSILDALEEILEPHKIFSIRSKELTIQLSREALYKEINILRDIKLSLFENSARDFFGKDDEKLKQESETLNI